MQDFKQCADKGVPRVLLATVMVNVHNEKGKIIKCRDLLDSGSQINFITNQLASQLGLKLQKDKATVTGISQSLTQVSNSTKIKISLMHNHFNVTIKCLVLKQITENLTLSTFPDNHLKIPDNIQLADPTYYKSNKIEIGTGKNESIKICNVSVNKEINEKIEKFWELEELTTNEVLTTKGLQCGQNF